MKKLILAIILTVFTVTAAQAADQVITITIPDQHVVRVVDAITNGMDCEGLGPKACLKRELIRHIRNLVKSYESSQIIHGANIQIGEIVDPEIN